MPGIALGELVGAAGPWLVGITIICLGNCLPVLVDCVARNSEDRADFLEGHGMTEARIAKSKNASSFGGGTNGHTVECVDEKCIKTNIKEV